MLSEGGDGSVKLTCDLVLRPPPPRVSTDCLIPIKAGDLQKEDALDAGEQACFPKLEVANDRFAPAVVGTTAEHYKNVARAWAAPRPDFQGLLDFWADSLFWISSPSGKRSRGMLEASVPKMYIEKHDQLWTAAPSLTRVG